MHDPGKIVADLAAALALGGDRLADKAAPAWKKTSGFHPVTAFADHGADGNGEPLAIVLRNGSACYLRNSAGSMIK